MSLKNVKLIVSILILTPTLISPCFSQEKIETLSDTRANRSQRNEAGKSKDKGSSDGLSISALTKKLENIFYVKPESKYYVFMTEADTKSGNADGLITVQEWQNWIDSGGRGDRKIDEIIGEYSKSSDEPMNLELSHPLHPSNLWLDRVMKRPQRFKSAPEEIRGVRYIAMEALKADRDLMDYVPNSLRNDSQFIYNAVTWARPTVYVAPNPKLLDSNPFGLWEKQQDLLDGLSRLGIKKPERLKWTIDIEKLIFNRDNILQKDGRPLMVATFSYVDWNSAFNTPFNGGLFQDNYRVLYYEIPDRKTWVDALLEATMLQPADLLMIGAHGTETSMRFGEGAVDGAVFTPENVKELRRKDVRNAVRAGGVIVLLSCSTGKGRNKAVNIANTLHTVWPHAHIFAPEADAWVRSDRGYVFSNATQIEDIHYRSEKGERVNTYHIFPDE